MRVLGAVKRCARTVARVPEWCLLRVETVTGQSRGVWAVLLSSLVVGAVASVATGFVVYRSLNSRSPLEVRGEAGGEREHGESADGADSYQ